MAIPNNYIDKITNKDSGESRIISPAADKVRVDNENFEGTDLDEVLGEVAAAIGEAGSGDGTVTGVKVGSTTYEPTDGVVDISPAIPDTSGKANKSEMSVVAGTGTNADKTTITLKEGTSATVLTQHQDISGKVDKNGTDSLMTAAEHTKLQNLPTNEQLIQQFGSKANDADVVKSISVNGGQAQTPTNGNVNISVPTLTFDEVPTAGSNNAVKSNGIKTAIDQVTPTIDPTTKRWIVGGQLTDIVAEGQDGQDGNSGVASADGIESVNNLNGGTTDTQQKVYVLGANQGKELKDMIKALEGGESNLITTLSHAFIGNNGAISDYNQYWMCTNYIAIEDISSIDYYSGCYNSVYNVALYDSTKTFVRGIRKSSGNVTINSLQSLSSQVSIDGCAYVRFSYQLENPTGRCAVSSINDVGIYNIEKRLTQMASDIAETAEATSSQTESVLNLAGENVYLINITDSASLEAAIAAGQIAYGYIKQDGVADSSSAWLRTGYIETSAINLVVCKSITERNVSNIALYNSEKSFIGYIANANVTNMDGFGAAVYARFCIQKESSYTLQVGRSYGPGLKQTNEELSLLKQGLSKTISYGEYNIPLYQSGKYIHKNGSFATSEYHNLYKLDGEGKTVRIVTKSDDNGIHPLAGLYDSSTDTLIRWLLYPMAQANVLNTYTFDININDGEYVVVSAYQNQRPTYTYILDGDTGLTHEQIIYDEAVARARFEKYRHDFKSVMLDCGRKYFSVTNIKSIIDAIAAAGLNTLELHYSEDQGLRLALNDMTIDVDGQEYDLSQALGDGISSGTSLVPDGSDKYLTQSDMDEIISYADSKNVRIVPAMDMPGHMGAILQAFPKFKSTNSTLNYGTPHARKFALAVMRKYASYFASKNCKFFNMCADEADVNVSARFLYSFINELAHTIIDCGMIPMAFNDFIGRGTGYNYTNKGIVVEYWWGYTAGSATVESLLSQGYTLINANHQYYLIYNGEQHTPSSWANYRVNNFSGYVVDKPDGGQFCVWCDKGNVDGDDEGDAFTPTIIDCITYYGQSMSRGWWNGQMKFTNKPLWWNGSAWVDATGNSGS